MGSKTKIFIVLEFATGGELLDKIINHGWMRENEARKYFQQLINDVDYCHSRGVYHRDLKPKNLLLDAYGNLKVSDFGLSALSQQVRKHYVKEREEQPTMMNAFELISTSKGLDLGNLFDVEQVLMWNSLV